MSKARLVAVCLASSVFFPAFSAESALTILEGDNIAPYAIPPKGESEFPSGVQVDIFRTIFENSPWTLKFKFVPLARVSTDLEKLGASGSSRMTGDPGVAGFYSDPYIAYRACIITLDTTPEVASIADMKGKIVIGFQGASKSFGPEFEKMTTGNEAYSEMNNQLSQLALLLKDRADAIVADIYISKQKQLALVEEMGVKAATQGIKCNKSLSRSKYKAFFRDQKVAEWFNKKLKEIIENGIYEKILEKYGLENGLKK